MTALIRDKRGSIDLIEFVLILPIFILLIYGFFEVWKIVSVKQSLDAGTYQAVRCRSIYNIHHNGSMDMVEDEYRCEQVLLTELTNNGLIDEYDLTDVLIKYYNDRGDEICVVAVDQEFNPYQKNCPRDPTTLACNKIFSIEAELPLPWSIFIPGLRSRDQNPTPTFMARHTSYIECGPTWTTTP